MTEKYLEHLQTYMNDAILLPCYCGLNCVRAFTSRPASLTTTNITTELTHWEREERGGLGVNIILDWQLHIVISVRGLSCPYRFTNNGEKNRTIFGQNWNLVNILKRGKFDRTLEISTEEKIIQHRTLHYSLTETTYFHKHCMH